MVPSRVEEPDTHGARTRAQRRPGEAVRARYRASLFDSVNRAVLACYDEYVTAARKAEEHLTVLLGLNAFAQQYGGGEIFNASTACQAYLPAFDQLRPAPRLFSFRLTLVIGEELQPSPMEVMVELERELESLVSPEVRRFLGEAGPAGAALEPVEMKKMNGTHSWMPPISEAQYRGHVEALGERPAAKLQECVAKLEEELLRAHRALQWGGLQAAPPPSPPDLIMGERRIFDLAPSVPDAVVEPPQSSRHVEPRLPAAPPEHNEKGSRKARAKKERAPLIVVRKQPLPPAARTGHADRPFRAMPITCSGQGDHPGHDAAG